MNFNGADKMLARPGLWDSPQKTAAYMECSQPKGEAMSAIGRRVREASIVVYYMYFSK